MTTATHRAWCNSHIDDEDGPGFCSRESEPAPTFGVDVTEHGHGVALVLWHPMRPGQDRRPFTAAELVEAEGGEPKAYDSTPARGRSGGAAFPAPGPSDRRRCPLGAG